MVNVNANFTANMTPYMVKLNFDSKLSILSKAIQGKVRVIPLIVPNLLWICVRASCTFSSLLLIHTVHSLCRVVMVLYSLDARASSCSELASEADWLRPCTVRQL
eukprot:987525_1